MICKYCNSTFEGKRSDAQYCSSACGNRFRGKKYVAKNKDTPEYKAMRNAGNDKFRAKPEGKYSSHKHRAKQSGVEFNLTFDEWMNIWEPYWDQRGIGGMVMCRTGDTGPYEVGNVRIDTQANNNREAHNLRRNL